METYQKRIRDLREDADKTQAEIAEILGTSQTMYARYERGANELADPPFNPARAILGVSPTISWGCQKIPGH